MRWAPLFVPFLMVMLGRGVVLSCMPTRDLPKYLRSFQGRLDVPGGFSCLRENGVGFGLN